MLAMTSNLTALPSRRSYRRRSVGSDLAKGLLSAAVNEETDGLLVELPPSTFTVPASRFSDPIPLTLRDNEAYKGDRKLARGLAAARLFLYKGEGVVSASASSFSLSLPLMLDSVEVATDKLLPELFEGCLIESRRAAREVVAAAIILQRESEEQGKAFN